MQTKQSRISRIVLGTATKRFIRLVNKAKRQHFEKGLKATMERTVPKPRFLTRLDGKKVEYVGP